MPPVKWRNKMRKMYGKLGGRKKGNNQSETLSENRDIENISSNGNATGSVPPTTSTITTRSRSTVITPSTITRSRSTVTTPSNATFTNTVIQSSYLWSAKKRKRRADNIDTTYSDPSSSSPKCLVDVDFLHEILGFVRCKGCGGETNATVKVLCFSTIVNVDCACCGKVVFSNKHKEMPKIK